MLIFNIFNRASHSGESVQRQKIKGKKMAGNFGKKGKITLVSDSESLLWGTNNSRYPAMSDLEIKDFILTTWLDTRKSEDFKSDMRRLLAAGDLVIER